MSALYSLFITVFSTLAILLFTSMCAWYITRVDNKLCRGIYYFCVFSMIVPFQMVMYTLSKTADTLRQNNPLGIIVIYLGFGAGLAVFMFCGFVKSIPLEVEEAANIDGCGPLRTFFWDRAADHETDADFRVYLGDYVDLERLPSALSGARYQVLSDDPHSYPIFERQLWTDRHRRYHGADRAFDHPDRHFYFTCQKHIIKGIMAGAVKG